MRSRVIALTTLTVAACVLLQVGINVVGARTAIALGRGNTRLSLVLIILAFAASLVAFVALVGIGYADRERDALYWPLLLLFGALSLYLGQTSAGATDFLLHGLRPRWLFLNESAVRLWQNALLLLVGGAVL
jgi:hypothetical protein